MLKIETHPHIFDRLYRPTSPHANVSTPVLDNIHFVNKNCKFLSNEERETAISYLKKRHQQLEAIIADFKQNNATKNELKKTFYAVIYPKRLAKMSSENKSQSRPSISILRQRRNTENNDFQQNVQQDLMKANYDSEPLSPKTATLFQKVQRSDQKETQNRFETMHNSRLYQPDSKKFQHLEAENTNSETRARLNTTHVQTKKLENNTKDNSKQETFTNSAVEKKLTEIDLFTQRLQKWADNRLKPNSISSANYTQESQLLDNVKSGLFYANQPSNIDNSSVGAPAILPCANDLGPIKSAIFATGKPIKTQMTNEEEYRRGRIPSSLPARRNNHDDKGCLFKEPALRPDIYDELKEENHNWSRSSEKQFNNLQEDTCREDLSDCSENHPKSAGDESGFEEDSLNARAPVDVVGKSSLKTSEMNLDKDNHKQLDEEIICNALKSSSVLQVVITTEDNVIDVIVTSESREVDDTKEEHVGEDNAVSQKDSKKILNETDNALIPQRMRLDEDSQNTYMESPVFLSPEKNMLDALTETHSHNINTVSDYQENMQMNSKDSNISQDHLYQSYRTAKQDSPKDYSASAKESYSHKNQGLEIQEYIKDLPQPSGTSGIETNTNKQPEIQEEQEYSYNPTSEKADSKSVAKEQRGKSVDITVCPQLEKSYHKRSISTNERQYPDKESKSASPNYRSKGSVPDSSQFFGGRPRRYVSVNLLKKIFDENAIYTENILDEIFMYLEDYVVNKNYFVQILTNYLNCLPSHYDVRARDISNRVFELSDRNNDGLITINDLGSTITLFTQPKPERTDEWNLYRILDPQNRGFIIETDIINALTKTQTLMCSNGEKLFVNREELIAESTRIFKELDKEDKGIVTYWDVYFWKDTDSFKSLTQKLSKYANNLDELTCAKKSEISMNTPQVKKEIDVELEEVLEPITDDTASPNPMKPFNPAKHCRDPNTLLKVDRYIEVGEFNENPSPEEDESKKEDFDMRLEELRVTPSFSAPLEVNQAQKEESKFRTNQSGEQLERSNDEYIDDLYQMNLYNANPVQDVYGYECDYDKAYDKNNAKQQGGYSHRVEDSIVNINSEVELGTSTDLPSRKEVDTSRTERDLYRYCDDFDFTENDLPHKGWMSNIK